MIQGQCKREEHSRCQNSFCKTGKSTIERWYRERYWHEEKRKESRTLPRVLDIDEHFFSHKEGYATTFCNLEKNKIVDVVKGRSKKDLESYLKKLRQ